MKTKNPTATRTSSVILSLTLLLILSIIAGPTARTTNSSGKKKDAAVYQQPQLLPANKKKTAAQKIPPSAVLRASPRADLVIQAGHSDTVNSVAFGPDGKTLASGSSDYTIKLWDVESGRELRTLTGHSSDVMSVAFSPDGKTLASGSSDNTIMLWDVNTGKGLRTRFRNSSLVMSVAFSPEGKTLATGFQDSTIKLWDAQNGKKLLNLIGHSLPVTSIAFSPDGKTLASGSSDNRIKLWDVKAGKELRTFSGHYSMISSVTFSPDGKILASGGWDNTIKLWDTESGKELRTFTGHSSMISSVAFSPDGKILASASWDNTIKFWNLKDGKELRTYSGHSSAITSVAFNPNGKILASGSLDKTIKLWDVTNETEPRTLSGHSSLVESVVFSPDGTILASASWDHTIKLWGVKNGGDLRVLSGHSEVVNSISFSPDGKTLASGSSDKTIKLWDVETGKELKTFSGHRGSVWSVAFSTDGSILASTSDFTIKLWNAKSGQELKTLNAETSHLMSIAFCADGKTLASGGEENSITLWDWESGKILRTLTGHASVVEPITFSSDGKMLASGSQDKTIKLWDVESGRLLKTLRGHSDMVKSISFGRGGEMLVSGSWDGAIKFWDVRSGRELPTLKAHSRSANSVSLKFNGKIMASGSFDTKIKLWNVATGEELCTLIVLDKNDWVVVTPLGRFDTNTDMDSPEGLHWVVSDDPLKPVPLEILMRDYYEPQLLPRLLKCAEKENCDEEFLRLPQISELNRVQSTVKITNISRPDASRMVRVTVEVGKGLIPAGDCMMKRCETDAFDLRLFRDRHLVGSFPDNGQERLIERREDKGTNVNARKNRWREATRIVPDGKTGTKSVIFNVQLPRSKNAADIDFSAYAFNEDRVKSKTAKWNWPDKEKAELPMAENVNRRTFIVSVGVNASENEEWRLQFAARDASEMQRVLTEKLRAAGDYDVLNIPLISDYDAQNNLAPNNAAKKKIEAVFALLGGKNPNEEQWKLIGQVKRDVPDLGRLPQIRPTPDDAVIISFSSHGYADNRGNFYLLPYDIGKESRHMKDAVNLAISSDELSLWTRDIDAGNIVMIIDACHAAASVENREFKPGPMGSRGLGQMAYDKDIKILAATKADSISLEIGGKFRQGLLSYALLQEGLEKSLGDFKPKDGKVFLEEWLEYGEMRVPSLYDDIKNNRLEGVKGVMLKGSESLITVLNKQDPYQQRPSLFNFNRKSRDIIVSRQSQ